MPFANVPADKQDKMHHCVVQLKADGYPEESAIAICYSSVVESKPIQEAIEANYPWDRCIADQMKQYGDMEKAKKVCGAIKRDYGAQDFEMALSPDGQALRDTQALLNKPLDHDAPFTHARGTLALSLTPKDTAGHVWEVTIIGPAEPSDVVTIDGEQYVKSDNDRYYSIQGLEAAAPMFDGAKSYDDHLTDQEFTQRGGMRPPGRDWLASIVEPAWDRATHSIKALYKVVDDAFAQKLLRAKELGVLNTIGLSIDVFQDGVKRSVAGKIVELVRRITQVNSVDAVGSPAAGGGFVRLLESFTVEGNMDLMKQIEQLMAAIDASLLPDATKAALKAELDKVKAEGSPPAQGAQPTQEQLQAQKAAEAKLAMLEGVIKRQIEAAAKSKPAPVAPDKDPVAEAQKILDAANTAAQRIIDAAKAAESQRVLEAQLGDSGLPPKAREVIRKQFSGRVFEADALKTAIEDQRAILIEVDGQGDVSAHGHRPTIRLGRVTEADRYQLDLLRLMLGATRFAALDIGQKDAKGREIFGAFKELGYTRSIENWVADGKPALPRSLRLSNWYYELTGGGVMADGDFGGTGHFARRAVEANLTTTTLASLVKNAVNIILTAEYSVRQQWWDDIVEQEDVDTIDQATLVRLFGASTLSIVPEGAPYTELTFADEEETASFYKRGNYIGVTLETFLRDKLNKLQRIPTVLANSWYNTVGGRVAAVFTINTAAGPTMSDTGALFNATAVASATGHANLLTTALAADGVAVTAVVNAMKKQTDQPLGAGERLGNENRPTHLLVPIDLSTVAERIVNSERITGSANNDINPHYKQYKIVEVPNWTDATDWAMLAKPMGRSPINLIWLRGRRTPELVENTDEATGGYFTNDELRFKVRKFMAEMLTSTEYCAPVADWRSLHKSNVAG